MNIKELARILGSSDICTGKLYCECWNDEKKCTECWENKLTSIMGDIGEEERLGKKELQIIRSMCEKSGCGSDDARCWAEGSHCFWREEWDEPLIPEEDVTVLNEQLSKENKILRLQLESANKSTDAANKFREMAEIDADDILEEKSITMDKLVETRKELQELKTRMKLQTKSLSSLRTTNIVLKSNLRQREEKIEELINQRNKQIDKIRIL